jgi:hypothetical protein
LQGRLKTFTFTPEFLVDLVTPGRHAWEVVENGLPSDARPRGCRYDERKARFEMVIESASYPIVPDGTALPEAPCPVFRTPRVTAL